MKSWMLGGKLFPFMNTLTLGVGEGGGDDDWKSGLPEPVRHWEEVKNSDSPDKFWDQMSNMKSMIGQSIRVPSKEASSADWDKFHSNIKTQVPGLMAKPDFEDESAMTAFYSAIGKPDEAKAYEVPEVDLKGVEVDMSNMDGLKELAHKLNLTKEQFKGLATELTNVEVANVTDQTKSQTENLKGLRDEWGLAFEDRTNAISNFIELTDAPAALKEAAKAGKLDADSLKWMHGIVDKFGGAEGMNLNLDRSRTDIMTPEEAKKRISEIMHNREHAYWISRDPHHADALQEMVKLQRFANPPQKESPFRHQ